MTSQPEDRPFSESNLDSPEYRQRLQRKLNCLIAVLEVACAKVRRSLTGPDADIERLTRIQTNLQDTLKVCKRARKALERREALPEDLPGSLSNVIGEHGRGMKSRPKPRMQTGSVVEMSSPEEFDKFKELGPIAADEIFNCDLDGLGRMFQQDGLDSD